MSECVGFVPAPLELERFRLEVGQDPGPGPSPGPAQEAGLVEGYLSRELRHRPTQPQSRQVPGKDRHHLSARLVKAGKAAKAGKAGKAAGGELERDGGGGAQAATG